MKRKDYRRPTMQVVQLKHHGMLMTSVEGSQATVQNYGWKTENEE